MIPKDYGFAPGINLPDPISLLARPDQLKRLFNRIRPSFSIKDASNESPIVVTTTDAHFLATGDQVTITRVDGNTAANGPFTVTVVDEKTFSLNGSTGNGDYADGTGSVVLAQRGETIDRLSASRKNNTCSRQ